MRVWVASVEYGLASSAASRPGTRSGTSTLTHGKLTRPTAKGIFGNLHLWFHASQGRPVEKDYAELCNLLNVQAYPHLSKIRSTMGLALDELVKIKYVQKWGIEKMVSKRGFKVILIPGEELLRILDSSRSDRRLQTRVSDAQPETQVPKPGEQEAIARLLAYGILPATARSLVTSRGVERVAVVADYIDSQLHGPAGRNIANPAGLLIHSLENELPIPAWFTASRQQEAARQEASERAEHRQKAELQYIEWQNTKRDVIFAERFTERELEVSIDAIVAEQSKKDPTLRRWSREAKRVYGRDSLWRELRASLGLPTFDEWLSDTAQASLF